MKRPRLPVVLGQPCWHIASNVAEAYVTRTGGHVGPVTFRLGRRKIRPLAVAPWVEEHVDPNTPTILRVLRGDFFCMPFGGNATAYRGEQHPVHGETANSDWSCTNNSSSELVLELKTRIRPSQVVKRVTVVHGQTAIYQRHTISEVSGQMSLGHHAMIRFPEPDGSGLVSVSAFSRGQVFIDPVEQPAHRGYSSLKPGATFASLDDVPTVFGTRTDLSRYPGRRGYEDLVQITADPTSPRAWSAVVFPAERYAWFSLKDARVLPQTILWISNGGRHYAPWNGRHLNVMGIEEVCSYFHLGLAESVRPKDLGQSVAPTSTKLSTKKPLTVDYTMAVVSIPTGFDHVQDVRVASDGTATLTSRSGESTGTQLTPDLLPAAWRSRE